MVSFELIKFQR